MNDFRDRIHSDRSSDEPLLRSKKRSRSEPSNAALEESFAEVPIAREAVRVANHRDGDRHRLDSQSVEILHKRRKQAVTLVNVSGGGAMIEDAQGLKLWDRVELRLCEWGKIDAAVRWIRNGRYGLEFAPETRIDGNPADIAKILQAVADRPSPPPFEPVVVQSEAPPPGASSEEDRANEGGQVEREVRHPLIWSGLVHYDHDTINARIRNISAGGALVECGQCLKVGAELLLELEKAGSFFATATWAHGDAAGLKFLKPFDLQHLASSPPTQTSERWMAPDHLRDGRASNSPWLAQWGRKG